MSSDPFYASQFESSPRIEWSTRGHPSHFVKQLVGKVQGTAFSVQTKEANAHLPIENEPDLMALEWRFSASERAIEVLEESLSNLTKAH